MDQVDTIQEQTDNISRDGNPKGEKKAGYLKHYGRNKDCL